MNTFSIYDPATGLFSGKIITGPASWLHDMMLLHPDESFIVGEYDKLSQCVDTETGEVIDYQPPQPGPQYVWDTQAKRWVYVKTPTELLADAQKAAMARVNAECADRLASVRAGYPADEVESWSKQEAEARSWIADNAASTPLLSAMSDARGMPLSVLAGKIVEKAGAFAAVSGQIIGARQAAEDRIGAAADADAVAAIVAALFPETEPGSQP